MVKLFHPLLGRWHEFPARTAKIWLRSGWRLTAPPDVRASEVASSPAVESIPDEGTPDDPSTEEE